MFTDKNEKPIVVILLILVMGLIISLMFAMNNRLLFEEPTAPPYGDDDVMCTMEAKICPDGSSVGRMPPSCEFTPCPGVGEETPIGIVPPVDDDAIGGGIGACTMEARMCPDGVTFVGRSGPDCEFEACPLENDIIDSDAGGDVVCAEIYAPVCAAIDVQCIKAPCPAVEKTFSNECEANKVLAEILFEGICE